MNKTILNLLEKNYIPDFLIRIGIRKLIKNRLEEEGSGGVEEEQIKINNQIEFLKKRPIAENTKDANKQHYELPTDFFKLVLGKNLKYSCSHWGKNVKNLDTAEDEMLELTCKRAELKDGLNILELGCGWGSLSLYMAKKFPKAKITAISNSKSQKDYIEKQAEQLGISNLQILTIDINVLTNKLKIEKNEKNKFDRIVSVEMFEHVRNYEKLFEILSLYLKKTGLLFVHIFSHYKLSYLFEVKDESDWLTKYFFTGGTMPSDKLFFYFNKNLRILKHWNMSGIHYQKTCEAWLKKLDKNKIEINKIFNKVYGIKNSLKWLVYWRTFFMSCSELWGYSKGKEWIVSHYLFSKN